MFWRDGGWYADRLARELTARLEDRRLDLSTLLADAIAAKQGRATAAQIVTGALGDLIGSVESETSGLTAKFKLQIK